MLEDLLVVAGSVVTLFLLMAVGFFFGKRGMLSSQALSQMSTLLLYVVCPAIMIDTFLAETCDGPTVRLLLVAGGALVGTYVLNMLLIPLCLLKDSVVDAALVVSRTQSGRYQGETVYSLDWAYKCARLVYHVDSDWLKVGRPSDGDADDADDDDVSPESSDPQDDGFDVDDIDIDNILPEENF